MKLFFSRIGKKCIHQPVRLVSWAIILTFGTRLLVQNAVPLSTLHVAYMPHHPSSKIRGFADNESDVLIGTHTDGQNNAVAFRTITKPDTSFTVAVPQPFTGVEATLRYRNPDEQQRIILGLQQADGSYLEHTIADQDPLLAQLDHDWEMQRDGDLVLWQKKSLNPEQRYHSVKDFLRQPPQPAVTLQYHYTLPAKMLVQGYQPSTTPVVLAKSLRGNHTIATYIGSGEKLSFTFSLEDINRHIKHDPFVVELWDAGEKLQTFSTKPLGSYLPTGMPSSKRIVVVEKTGLPEGQYFLKITTPDDVFIKQIATMQHELMFEKHLYVADNAEYTTVLRKTQFTPTTVVTDSTKLTLATAHQRGLQSVRVGGQSVRVHTPHQKETVEHLSGDTAITTPVNDIQMDGDGYFVFAPLHAFSLQGELYADLTATTNLAHYQYVIGSYPFIAQDHDWLVAKTSFSSSEMFRNKGVMRFQLTMPNLDMERKTLQIASLDLVYTQQRLGSRTMAEKLRTLVQRQNPATQVKAEKLGTTQ